MKTSSYLYGQFVLLFISLAVLLSSLYFQYIQDLNPCPLCLMQRLCVVLFLLSCVIAIITKHKNMLGWQLVFAIAGLYFAGRQLWLQSLPSNQVPACLPGLDIMMQYFPWKDIMHALFWGAADCAEDTWHFLGLNMPTWAGLYFLIMLISVFVLGLQLKKSRERL